MNQESIQPVLDWITAHPSWSGFIVFLISVSESLAIVGLVVPGVVLMTAIGSMMGAGILPFWETLIWAILGAIVGDGISYWLGYHYHEKLRNYWPFKQFPGLLARGENFFRQHGGKSIIFGRFVGPVRPMIPVIAGMMDMTPKRFLVFNILSAIAWAPIYSLPGILIGYSLGNLPPEAATRVGFLIVFLLLALWLLYEFFLIIGKGMIHTIQKTLNKIWRVWQNSNRLPYLHKALHTAQGTEEGQLGTLILFIIASITFIITFYDVMNGVGLSNWNEPIYQLLRALYSTKLIHFFAIITNLGDPLVLMPAITVLGLLWLFQKRYITALCWFATIGLGFASGALLKNYVQMPRPEGLLHFAEGYSFPGGHTLVSTLTYGLAAALIYHSASPKYRNIAWLIAIPLIILIAFSRLYLGVHWFTDILGGITLGTAFVALGMLFYRRFETRHLSVKGLVIPGVLITLIMAAIFSFTPYSTQAKHLVRNWPVTTISREEWWQGTALSDLYRTGAIKRQATIFDIQWLGLLDNVKAILEKEGFKETPKLNLNTGLLILANNPSPYAFPVMPKFHRDRLPVLSLAKEINTSHRLVIQLWNSDFISQENIPLWVGTLRIEEAKHPVPLTTLFVEQPYDANVLMNFLNNLKTNANTRTQVLITQKPQLHDILKIDSSKAPP